MIGTRRRRPLSLPEVIVLTSPLVLGLVLAAAAAVSDFIRARQFDDPWSLSRSLSGAFAGHVAAALRTPSAMIVRQRLDATADDAIAIRLLVPAAEWDRSIADPFVPVGDWVDAILVRPGSNRDVNVRRRGDTSVHWMTPKVSFTLRAPRGERIRGFRELALSGKTVLESQVASRIPAELGVRTPRSSLTPVYLNERYYGLFRAVEPIDESFLRRAGWMPGDVFRADAAERGEYYKNLPRNVITNPYIWERVAVGADDDAGARANLASFLGVANETTLASHIRLMERIDRDALTRLLAAMLVSGDPYHMSGVHNHFWFEDPSTGTLTPIPWDLRLRRLDAPATNPLNDLLLAALRDPFLADQVLRVAHEAIGDGLLERLGSSLSADEARLAPHLEYEHLRRELVSDPGDPAVIRQRLAANAELLESWAADARTGFSASYESGRWILDFETRGFAGSDLVGIDIEGVPGAAARLVADRDLDGTASPGDAPVGTDASTSGLEVTEPVALLPGWRHDNRRFQPGRVHYRFFLEGVGGEARIRPRLVDRLTGADVAVETIERGTVLGDGIGFHAWSMPAPRGRTVRLAGSVRLDETLRLSSADTLAIDPGTAVTLGPDVSIISRGPVLIEGEPSRPVRFLPSVEGRPWGTLALQGPGAAGSRIRHATFVGGGGGRDGRIVYKGMITLHRVPGALLEGVDLEDNVRSDDALNAVHSRVRILRCRVLRANGDAIDFDYSRGSIEECTIEDSRNDAIDLMTSSPTIRSSRLLRSGDKGISIGEASSPRIVDNQIADGVRGLEIKDRSDPFILHNTIEGNRIGVLSSVKNWRYAGGGRGILALTRLTGNETDVELDEESTLSVIRSPMGDEPIEEAPVDAVPWWVHAAGGLAMRSSRPGAIGQAARWSEPLDPTWSDDEDATSFYDDPSGWARGGQLGLRVVDDVMVARIERGTAVWGRDVTWDLPRGGALVIELTGRNVRSLRVVVSGDGEDVVRDLAVAEVPGGVGLETVELPPGRYAGVRFEAESDARAADIDPATGLVERRVGRVELHRLRLFAMPETGGAP